MDDSSIIKLDPPPPRSTRIDYSFYNRAHHKNQRVVESTKISNEYKNSIYGLSLMRNNFLHKNNLFNLSFKGRWNLIQIPTSQNNVKKCGKIFSQLTNTKIDGF